MRSALPLMTCALLLAAAPRPASAEEVERCEGALSLAQVEQALADQPARIMGFEATDAAAELRGLTRDLACLDGPIAPKALAQLWFLRGLARLYAAEEGKAAVVGGEDVVRTLFEVAWRVDPELSWNDALFGDLGKDRWEDAVASAQAAAGGPSARSGAIPEGLDEVLVDGQPRAAGERLSLIPGVYLLQFHDGGGWHGAWLKVDEGDRAVELPLPAPAVAQASPVEEVAEVAPPPSQRTDASPAPEAAAEGDARSPHPAPQARRLKMTAMAQTWRLPQLYSGPEIGLKVGVSDRLWLGVAAGMGAGPWKDCRACLPAEGAYVLVPVRADATVVLGEHQPLSLHLGASWQSYLGGGFGLTGETLAASAHGLEANAAVAVGPGRVRLFARASAGWTLSPSSIAGPQAALGVGVLADLGGRR